MKTIDRRTFLKFSALATATLALPPSIGLTTKAGGHDAESQLKALEKSSGGRLGVAILDTSTGARLSYRGDERFLICSTFKLLLVAAVMKRVDDGTERPDRSIVFDRAKILSWAPVTGLNIGPPGMTVQELCEAAMIMSDNTAANLLLDTLGGPSAVTAYARNLGDTMTRLDNYEPLDGHQQGDDDTTTPWSILVTMQKILLGDALSEDSRRKLASWFALNQTGAQSLKRGLPSNWQIGDKTGASSNASNDIAIITPPGQNPLLVTALYMSKSSNAAASKAVLADVGRIVATVPATKH